MSTPDTPPHIPPHAPNPDTTRFGHPVLPAPPDRGRGRLVVAVVALGVLLLGAVIALVLVSTSRKPGGEAVPASSTSAPAAPAAVATTASRPSGSTVAFEPGGAKACAALGKLYGSDGMYDPDKLQPIGEQAVKSTDFDIRTLGQLLIDWAKLARAAKGHDDELTTKLDMSTTATNLLTRCTKAGYPTT